MDIKRAELRLSALAHETRLKVFRLLVKAGDREVPAGDIARRLGVPATTMSTHLGILARAELVSARRESRAILYSLNRDGVSALMAYLLDDCCEGRPELCDKRARHGARGAARAR